MVISRIRRFSVITIRKLLVLTLARYCKIVDLTVRELLRSSVSLRETAKEKYPSLGWVFFFGELTEP